MRDRGGGRYKNLAPREHFVVAAFAATKLCRVRFPRAERGAKFAKRAFARDRGSSDLSLTALPAVVIRFRFLHAVRDHGDRQSDLDHALEELRKSEADQQTDYG